VSRRAIDLSSGKHRDGQSGEAHPGSVATREEWSAGRGVWRRRRCSHLRTDTLKRKGCSEEREAGANEGGCVHGLGSDAASASNEGAANIAAALHADGRGLSTVVLRPRTCVTFLKSESRSPPVTSRPARRFAFGGPRTCAMARKDRNDVDLQGARDRPPYVSIVLTSRATSSPTSTVHGGVDKQSTSIVGAYAYWREQLPDFPLPWGAFGENFTTDGLSRKTLHRRPFADAHREFEVTSRACVFKLGSALHRADMVKRFCRADDRLLRASAQGSEVSCRRFGDRSSLPMNTPSRLRMSFPIRCGRRESDLLRRASEAARSSRDWRDYFRKRLWSG